MYIYIIINVFVGIAAVLNYSRQKSSPKRVNNIILLTIIFTFLLFISTFRGDFTSDYDSYIQLFNFFNRFTFKEIFSFEFLQEIGFVILNKTLGLITSSPIIFFFISSLLIISAHFIKYIKHSHFVFVSILLFINIGGYYTSFNITRQIMASSILFFGSDYLFTRKFSKFFIIVIISALIHRTALMILPFYFILNFKFSKSTLIYLLIAFVASFWILDPIITFIQEYVYAGYTENSYGMSGYKATNIIIPSLILILLVFNISSFDNLKSKDNIIANATIIYVILSLLGLQVQMIQRISYFFLPFSILAIDAIIFKIKNNANRFLFILVLVIIIIVVNYVTLSNTGYDPYRFLW